MYFYTVQPCEIKAISSPQSLYKENGLIFIESMDHEEFNEENLDKSFERILSNYQDYVLLPLDEFKDVDGEFLYLLCNQKDIDSIKIRLTQYLANQYPDRTVKEPCRLYTHFREGKGEMYDRQRNTKFWWDIDKDFMLMFIKDDLPRFISVMSIEHYKFLQK